MEWLSGIFGSPLISRNADFLQPSYPLDLNPCNFGGVLTPKKTKKNQKKPKKTKPIYQFWCSDWFFLVFFGFFWFFFGFFWFFWFFLVFFGIFWDDILTLNLNTKKNQKKPKNPKKNQKKPTEPKKPVSNFECWPRPMPKKTKKNQKKPKKTKKNQCQFGNLKKPKKTKKNQKKPMPIWKFKKTKKSQKKPKKTNGAQKTSFQFRILAKANAKKNQKKPKKTKKNQCQFGNLKKPKKTKKNQCQFTDFGVATGFFWFFLGEHPPNFYLWGYLKVVSILIQCPTTQNSSKKNIRREVRRVKQKTVVSSVENLLARIQNLVFQEGSWFEQIVNY